MKITERVVVALALVLCVSILCAPVCAEDAVVTETFHAVGQSALGLPVGVEADDVEGVVLERGGKFVPIAVSIESANVLVTPSDDLEPGADYNARIFADSGKRYLIRVHVEEFLKLDVTHECTVKVPAKPSKGFNYAYALYVPAGMAKDCRLMVNSLNDAPCTDRRQLDSLALKQASRGWASWLARGVQTPCLVPAFPREEYKGNDDYTYAQMLNRGAVHRDKIDSQLVAMIKDAQQQLARSGSAIADKVFVCGYSTDAKFAQRFTLLHPDMVLATIAGGVAGTTTFPVADYKGEKLNYPVGVADIEALTGSAFNKEEYTKVPQLFIMGETDTNDATQWRDCFSQQEADQINWLFGRTRCLVDGLLRRSFLRRSLQTSRVRRILLVTLSQAK